MFSWTVPLPAAQVKTLTALDPIILNVPVLRAIREIRGSFSRLTPAARARRASTAALTPVSRPSQV